MTIVTKLRDISPSVYRRLCQVNRRELFHNCEYQVMRLSCDHKSPFAAHPVKFLAEHEKES